MCGREACAERVEKGEKDCLCVLKRNFEERFGVRQTGNKIRHNDNLAGTRELARTSSE